MLQLPDLDAIIVDFLSHTKLKTGGPKEVAAGLVKRFWAPDESILHTSWPKLVGGIHVTFTSTY